MRPPATVTSHPALCLAGAFLCLAASLPAGLSRAFAGECQPFVRGDANADGEVDLADAVRMLGFSFLGLEAPPCMKAADSNTDGVAAEVADAIHLLGHKFLGTTPPAAPFPGCGLEEEDSVLSCLSYLPCPVDTSCSDVEIDPEEALELIEAEFTANAEATLSVDVTMLRVGDMLEVATDGVTSSSPAWLDWGDGSRTPVLEDGSFAHTYGEPRTATIWLLDEDGRVRAETFVEVVSRLEVLSVDVFPAGPGGGAQIGEPRQPQGPQNPPGQGQEVPQPMLLIPERQFPQGMRGAQFDLAVTTSGWGILEVRVVAQDAAGNEAVLVEAQSDRGPQDNTLHIQLPPLPTDLPGITQMWIEIRTDRGVAGGSGSSFPVQVVPADVNQPDPCERIRLAYMIVCGVLTIRQADCDALRQQLADAKAELEEAKGELSDAENELADEQRKAADLQDQYNNLKSDLNAVLGDTGEIKDDSEVGSDDQFVGNGGVGVAFSSAPALLGLSDSVGSSGMFGGKTLLAMVNELGQMKKQLAKQNQKVVNAQSRVQGLEAKVSGIQDRIDDLADQLEDCEREVMDWEGEKVRLEDEWRQCIADLILKGIIEEGVRQIEDELRRIEQGLGGFGDDASDTRAAVDGSPGTAGEHASDHEGVDAAEGEAGAAGDAAAATGAKLETIREAVQSGDLEAAEPLLQEARDCLDEASAHFTEALKQLDAVGQAIAQRCRDGERKDVESTNLRTEREYFGFHIARTPVANWAEVVSNARKAAEQVAEAASEGNDFLAVAHVIIPYFVDLNALFIELRLPWEVYVLFDEYQVTRSTFKECVNGRWVDSEETVRSHLRAGNQLIGTVYSGSGSTVEEIFMSKREKAEAIAQQHMDDHGWTPVP